MDPPLVNESSFSAANPSSYSLAEIWPFRGETGSGGGGGLGLRMGNLVQSLGGLGESSANRDGSVEESTVTEQSGGGRKRRDVSSEDESSKIVSTSSANDLVGLELLCGQFFISFFGFASAFSKKWRSCSLSLSL